MAHKIYLVQIFSQKKKNKAPRVGLKAQTNVRLELCVIPFDDITAYTLGCLVIAASGELLMFTNIG